MELENEKIERKRREKKSDLRKGFAFFMFLTGSGFSHWGEQ
jgi:hypothetical protein